ALEVFVQLGDRLLHGERRAYRPFGVVLVSDRRAEDRHDRVADVLVDRAAEGLELTRQCAEELREDETELFRIQSLAEGGRARKVREEDGDLSALVREVLDRSAGDLERRPRACRRGRGGKDGGAAPRTVLVAAGDGSPAGRTSRLERGDDSPCLALTGWHSPDSTAGTTSLERPRT